MPAPRPGPTPLHPPGRARRDALRRVQRLGALLTTTQTGIPIHGCPHCGSRHPVTRRHCPSCGLATLFGHEECTPNPEQLDMLALLEEMTS